MIVDVEKYLIFGSKEKLDEFLQEAQKLGVIEFITPKRKKIEAPQFKKMVHAYKILQKRISPEPAAKDSPYSAQVLSEKVVHAFHALENIDEKKRIIRSEIARVSPFGDFSKKELEEIEQKSNRYFQFFSKSSSKKNNHPIPKEMIYIGTEYDLDYFITFTKKKKNYPSFTEMKVETPVGLLRSKLGMLEEESKLFHKQLQDLSAYTKFLEEALIDFYNSFQLSEAKQSVDTPISSIFVVEAWIPVNKIQLVDELLSKYPISYSKVAIEKKDKIPTYMENKGTGKVGEDLVHVYDTPDITDKDPSRWVFWSFALFFGVIVSDGGYGFLYFLISLFLYWKFPHWTGLKKRFNHLCFTLSLFCMGWGVVTASFFGIDLAPDNPIRTYSVIHQIAKKKAEYHMKYKDDVYQEWVKKYPTLKNETSAHGFLTGASVVRDGVRQYEVMDDFYNAILMEFSLLVGMIHILFSLCRTLFRNPQHLGWIAFILGGYLFFPSILQATSLFHYLFAIPKEIAFSVGKLLLFSGIGIAFIISVIKTKISGLLEPMNAIQIFADILSYLRLYALALAGMIMASTFNQIASSMSWWVGIFVVIAGHGVNIILGIMGGVIHGLRLNFLEWYHYSFEGGGKIFNPLRLLKK